MTITLFQACNEFAAIALGVAACYLALIGVITQLAGLLSRFRTERPAICRPGEYIHQALKITGRRWDHCRTAALLFGVAFLLLLNFGRHGWWVPLPLVVNVCIAAAVLAVLVYGALGMIQLARYRARLGKLLDLHNNVARRLVEAQLRGNRVFHSIKIGTTVLDNVVVGRNGVYTVQLFSPPKGAESASLEQGALLYQPGASRRVLHPYSKAVRLLRETLTAEINNKVAVLPVIVIPDCKIEVSGEQGPMLVSLEACMSFIGWQDQEAFLMDDDIAAISAWLAGQTLAGPPRHMPEVLRSLGPSIQWPALLGRQ